MLAIVDYGVGNLFSLQSCLKRINQEVVVTKDPEVLTAAERIILPGVGAFGDAAAKLRQGGLDKLLCRLAGEGKPPLGICLGMQLLFEKSYEYGEHEGLGLIKGKIVPINQVVPDNIKVPHMGWNALHITRPHPLLQYVKEGDFVYFVHSYFGYECAHSTIATAEYGAELTAAVAEGNVMGCQFHPEKSGAVGARILQAFMEMKAGQAW